MDSDRTSKCDENSSNVAIAFIFIGISIIAICVMWPLPEYYVIDPRLSAAQNEANQLDLNRKQALLYGMTYLGMAMVTVGGLITACIMTKTLLYNECGGDPIDNEFESLRKKPPSKDGAQFIELPARSQPDKTQLVGSDYLAMNGASQGKSYGTLSTNGAVGTSK